MSSGRPRLARGRSGGCRRPRRLHDGCAVHGCRPSSSPASPRRRSPSRARRDPRRDDARAARPVSSGAVFGVESLAHDLRALGVARGSCVLVHSSLRAVGPVERGAGGAGRRAARLPSGPSGTLMAPTFTYGSARFDPGATPGRTGAVGEALRGRPTRDPLPAPVLLRRGARARSRRSCAQGTSCCRARESARRSTGSPRAGGFVLLLGVGHERSTMIHVGEFHAGRLVPRHPVRPRLADGGRDRRRRRDARRVSYDRFPGCSRVFGVIEPRLRARRAIEDGLVGQGDRPARRRQRRDRGDRRPARRGRGRAALHRPRLLSLLAGPGAARRLAARRPDARGRAAGAGRAR